MTTARYEIRVLQASGDYETIFAYAELRYKRVLNGISNFKITIANATTYDYDKFNTYEIGFPSVETGTVYILKEGTLELAGMIEDVDYTSANELIISGWGLEYKAKKLNTRSGRTYASQNLATTFADLVGDVSGLTLGTNDAFSGDPLGALDLSNIPFWDAFKKIVIDQANHDLTISYALGAGCTIGNVTFAGSSTTTRALVNDVDIVRIVRRKSLSRLYNRVDVIGRNEASLQITGTASDATSQSTYGVRDPPIPLFIKSLISSTAATDHSTSYLAEHKDPVDMIVSGEVVDLSYSPALGDVVTIKTVQRLTDSGSDKTTRDVRVVSIERIVRQDGERLILQFTSSTGKLMPLDPINNRFEEVEQRLTDFLATSQFYDQFWSKAITAELGLMVNAAASPSAGTFTVGASTTISMGSNRVRNVTDPVDAQDAATKAYVDSFGGTIDGSGTTNALAYWVDSDTIGAVGITISAGVLAPTTSIVLGSSGSRYQGLFTTTADLSGNLTVSGSTITAASATATLAALMVNGSGAFTVYVAGTIGVTGQLTSTVSTGTAPLVIASTTQVSNLNASYLAGNDISALDTRYVNASGDTAISGDLIPNAGGVDLGSSGSRFAIFYGDSINLNSSGVAITAASGSASLASLDLNGTGSETLYVAGSSQITGNANFSGKVKLPVGSNLYF